MQTASGLPLAPCTFCNRKPGYFADGNNYCYVHWFTVTSSDENNVSVKSNETSNSEPGVRHMSREEKQGEM